MTRAPSANASMYETFDWPAVESHTQILLLIVSDTSWAMVLTR